MTYTYKGTTSLYICLFTILTLFIACEDPGSIGGEYVERSELVFDTLTVQPIQNLNYSGYTGRLSHYAVGNYSDELFGDITAVAMLKPTLTIPAGKELNESYNIKLRLGIDNALTYGDTLSPVKYSIYEITSNWNGLNLRFEDNVEFDENTKIGEFTVGYIGPISNDSIVVDLADSWKNSFIQYSSSTADEDSLLQYVFNGLALVAEANTNKIIHLSRENTDFVAESPVDTTLTLNIRDWAYILERSNQNFQPIVNPLYSTIENVLNFSLGDYLTSVKGRNFIKAELVFFEASDELQNTLQTNERRPNVNSVKINLELDTDPEYEMQFGAVDILGTKNTSDNSFRFNLTDFFNKYLFANENRTDAYLSLGSSEGILKSTLIYNNSAPEALQPKLILTFLEGTN